MSNIFEICLKMNIMQRRNWFIQNGRIAKYCSKIDSCEKAKQDKQAQQPQAALQPKEPRIKLFKIYRYDPATPSKKPYFQTYRVDLNKCRPMVLDALDLIKSEQDSSISYRKSCREGICGSCGINVNGVNRLACLSKIKPAGTTTILPLPHMYILKDLVVDFKRFLRQHSRIRPYLIGDICTADEGNESYKQSVKDRDKLDGFIECILCGCCSTSCPEYWWHGHGKEPDDFLGPAALLNAYRFIIDSRDKATGDRLNQLSNYYNVYRCHQIMNCATCCPKRLNPGKAIAKLRLLMAGLSSKKKPQMDGTIPSDPYKACEKKDKNKC